MNELRYSADWLRDAANAAPEERATVADFRLFLGRKNVTFHLHGSELSDHVTIALYGLAEGIAHDWWSIFGGRDRTFSLLKHRSGYIVPDIRMNFDGAAFEISAHECSYLNPDVRFWAGPTEVMRRNEAEITLSDFVTEVLGRLDTSDVKKTSASLRWHRVQESRADSDEAAYCEAAGALGLDPYRTSDEDSESIQRAAALFEGEALSEFLAGVGSANKNRLLNWVEWADGRPRYAARVAELRQISLDAAGRMPLKENEPGWALGYRRAEAVRHVVGLKAGYRFSGFRALAEMLGASRGYALAGSVDGVRALRSDRDEVVHIHMRAHGNSPDSLFSFARAVGDAVCFPEGGRAPVNELRDARRQGAGRAFAAELLAPIAEIRSMREDGKDTVSIAGEFGVSTAVIDRQWENKDRIDAVLNLQP